MDIAVWLRGLGLERYELAFRDNEIDRETLPKLTAEDLKELGVVLGSHRRKLLACDRYLTGQRLSFNRTSVCCAGCGTPAADGHVLRSRRLH